jgi:dTMP kinase
VNAGFVVVEGIEASGKSSLVAGLAEHFRAARIDAIATREPGGTPLGDRVRSVFLERDLAIDPLAEAFLIAASRSQHVRHVIAPALASGRLVICDRFSLATFAYQGFGRGVDLELLRSIDRIATGGLRADLTLLVDVDVETSARRASARADERGERVDRLEAERREFHERVREGYLAFARDDASVRIIDGTRERERVLADALAQLERV